MNYMDSVQYGTGQQVSLLDTFVYATIDPGGGTSAANANTKTDKAGWTIGAVTLSSDTIILETGEAYMEIEEMLNLIYRIHMQWRPRLIGVERMMYLQQYFMKEMQRRRKILDLYTLQHQGRNKAERIKATLPFLKKTYFLEETVAMVRAAFQRWHERMVHGDDWIDSFAYLFDIAHPPDVGALRDARRERQAWAWLCRRSM